MPDYLNQVCTSLLCPGDSLGLLHYAWYTFVIRDCLLWQVSPFNYRFSFLPCQIQKNGHCQKAIDRNDIHRIWWACIVVDYLRSGKIFFYSIPWLCIPFDFVVGINVRVFSVSLLSGWLFDLGKSSSGIITPARYTRLCPCFKLIGDLLINVVAF